MIKKVKYIIFLSIFMVLILCTKSQARITTSDPTVNSGGTATITINSQEGVAYGLIDVTSDGGLTFVSVSGGTANGTKVAFAGTENKTSGIATYTFKVPEVKSTTTYKVTFSSTDMGDAEGNAIASSTATATVTVRGSSSGNSGSSSGGNSSSSGNNTSENTPTFTKVNETVYATSSVNVRSSYSTSSSRVGSLNKGDSVTRTGKGSNGWSRVSYNGQTAYINSEYLTTEKPEESNNKNLESLSISGDYTLSPEFSSDITEYSLTVGADIDSLDIKAIPEDDNAEVKITGNDNLLMGLNTIDIEVTAEDGTVRTYTINVTKNESGEVTETEGEGNVSNGLELTTLSVNGYELNPSFNSNIYEYTIDIYDPSVTGLNINAQSNIEGATIEIVGNEQLQLGENVITVLLKSGETVTTYQIVVNIMEKIEQQLIEGIDNDDLFLYVGIGLGVLILLVIIILVIKSRKKDDDDFSYYGGFDSLNRDVKENNRDDNAKKENKVENNVHEKIENSANNEDELSENKKEENKVEVHSTIVENSKVEETKKDRKSVIEENFGADIDVGKFDYDDERPKKKRGKHF